MNSNIQESQAIHNSKPANLKTTTTTTEREREREREREKHALLSQ